MNSAPRSPTHPLSSRTLLALTEALEHAFDAAAWARLGVELEMPQLADPELRLQKSLRFGDDDYGYCVAQVVRHLEAERPDALRDLTRRPEIRTWLESNAPGAAQELRQAPVTRPVEPAPIGKAVEQALVDAHQVRDAVEPVSDIHRAHDALHGYLLDVAARANLTVSADATVAQLYWSLANDHPIISAEARRSPQVSHVLASLAEAVTVLNSLRDGAPIDRANQAAPGETEVVLMSDLVRTLLNFVRARLEPAG